MGSTKPEKAEKKVKKDKKRSEAEGGVAKPKKDKKEKKERKEKLKQAVAAKADAALDDQLQADAAASMDIVREEGGIEAEKKKKGTVLPPVVGALVPFARPLADEKATKKIMKTVRKAAKHKTLKRGVKEVVKSLRKSPAATPGNVSFPGVVVLAGDISPMDVISHIPVLCEDVNAPYIFVHSRAELGAAGSTKRPTSVVMVTEKARPGKAGAKAAAAAPSSKDKMVTEEGEGKDEKDGVKEEEKEDFTEVYKELVRLVEKESRLQLKFSL